ncbi:MAG: DUF1146 domain-containing protein [Erysipelotrichaceae bacterium]|jgi:uncharacterized membrane protein YwzB|nr:DUF1146 domain-containing protein [Erysipelotrichaceae bacterium]MDO5108304.1 DUF1146 domain-containing protein [Erysipelotrichaceae bacterium]
MTMLQFYIRSAVYLICLVAAWYGMSAVNYEKILRQGHVRQAQILYFMIVLGLAYLSGSFILALVYSG